MSKKNDDGNLEYYQAKQDAGQLSMHSYEMKKPSKLSKSKSESTESKNDGYIGMTELPEKQRDFERYKEVTFTQKASERAKQNPLIPIGLLGTVAALTLGLRAMNRGDKWQSQMMMRARIGAQGFTIFAVLASIMYAGHSINKTEETTTIKRRSSSS